MGTQRSFLDEDFLLHSDAARELFHRYAKDEPIFDYHCHLDPAEIAADRRFTDLTDIWLRGDHYKWRAMRANGVPERFCTGDAAPKDKFLQWAGTVPHTLRNPLYHWTHLELRRYFGIETLLSPATAESVWEQANEKLRTPALSARGILASRRVAVVCTTDDPADSLEHHRAIAAAGVPTRVYPTFRPDKALAVHQPTVFTAWLARLAAVANTDTGTLPGLLDALRIRHDYFHSLGARVSDHGLESCPLAYADDAAAAAIFERARRGQAATPEEHAAFVGYMMLHFGRLDAAKGWTKQLHLGAIRNTNSRLHRELGADSGHDTIGDYPQGVALARYLDLLEREKALPKTVIYNLNPADNYLFAAMAGVFQDSAVAGKIQFGSGWWFLDQKEGIEWQLNALSTQGLLSRFVGMLTDSRSFLSYPRHEYFRRVLCNLLGRDIEHGELPRDFALVGDMVRRICYANAERYFGLVAGRV